MGLQPSSLKCGGRKYASNIIYSNQVWLCVFVGVLGLGVVTTFALSANYKTIEIRFHSYFYSHLYNIISVQLVAVEPKKSTGRCAV